MIQYLFIYLSQLGFHTVGVVSKLVQKLCKRRYNTQNITRTQKHKTDNRHTKYENEPKKNIKKMSRVIRK